MTLSSEQVRRRYLDFFVRKGHRLVPSASLVPEDDPTLLFTTAGMAQFKDAFMGLGRRDYSRATSCQKCLRVGDIDRVGRTAFHHTFFEMLGNFSFGDYFKEEAIPWAWELLVGEFKIPESRLQVTVFREDDEARQIWRKSVGLTDSRIHAMGEADNFWPANAPVEGPNGPCGPCSEIYYDRGAELGCGGPDCGPACNCGRWFEVWNLVFTQFERREGGVLVPLPRKNIDTGMGMERITAVLQGVTTSFDTDLVKPVVLAVADFAELPYEPKTEQGVRMRRIADHARALCFCIADGVLPSNEGRGYVLRRLLRRAARDARELGLTEPFLAELVPVVLKAMGRPYPDLIEREATLRQVLTSEEERFGHTLEQGSALLAGEVEKLKAAGRTVLGGEEAFRLYDTYGFPLDLIEQALSEYSMTADRTGFEKAMERQRDQSREGSSMKGDLFTGGPLKELAAKHPSTEFLGYDHLEAKAKVIGILLGDAAVSKLENGLEGVVVLDRSPFYAESGGQVGDQGSLSVSKPSGPGLFAVSDTRKGEGLILQVGRMQEGQISVGDVVTATVEKRHRRSTMRHHTATHLLHAALRKVLGSHVEQAGSLVSPQALRFDFRHPKAMTPEEIRKVEDLVNQKVLANAKVSKEVKPVAQAKAEGAMALFGEKYGDAVRVVTVGAFSKELCGGTHCRRTGDVGAVWILSERAVGSGVRRIEAVAGARTIAMIRQREKALRGVASALKATPEEAAQRAVALQEELKKARKEIEKLKQDRLSVQAGQGGGGPQVDGGVVWQNLGDGVPIEELRRVAETLKARHPGHVILLGASTGGEESKAALLFSSSAQVAVDPKGFNMNTLMRESAAVVGGKGGGKPDFAQGGGPQVEALDEALRLAVETAKAKLPAV